MRRRTLILFLSFLLIAVPVMATTPWTTKPPIGARINWGHPLSKGLVGCWLMNEGMGQRVTNIALNKQGTFVNSPTWNINRVKFVAGSIRIDNADDCAITGPWSVEIIAIQNDTSLSQRNIVTRSDNTASFLQNYALQFDTSKFRIGSDAAAYTYLSSNANLTQGQKYHLIGQWTGTKLEIYINGKFDNSVSMSTQPSAASGATWFLEFGCLMDGTSSFNRFISGEIETIRIRKGYLLPSQISSLNSSPYQFIEYEPWSMCGAIQQAIYTTIQSSTIQGATIN